MLTGKPFYQNVRFLAEKFSGKDSRTIQRNLAELVCIVIDEPRENAPAVLRHLCALGKGSVWDPLTHKNNKAVKEALGHHNL